MTKAGRVGTSICDSVVRASNKTTATGNVGANTIDGWRSGMYCRRLEALRHDHPQRRPERHDRLYAARLGLPTQSAHTAWLRRYGLPDRLVQHGRNWLAQGRSPWRADDHLKRHGAATRTTGAASF